MRKPTMRNLTRSDTNRAAQPPETARGWKFRIEEEEGLSYPSSENIVADQLRGYREADPRLPSQMQIVDSLTTRLNFCLCSFG